jgi:hypothetical protein
MSTAFDVETFAIVGFLGPAEPDGSDQILDSFAARMPAYRPPACSGAGECLGD